MPDRPIHGVQEVFKNPPLSELLLELMKAEHETRQANQYRRRLKAAGFPYQKSLDEFDFSQPTNPYPRRSWVSLHPASSYRADKTL